MFFFCTVWELYTTSVNLLLYKNNVRRNKNATGGVTFVIKKLNYCTFIYVFFFFINTHCKPVISNFQVNSTNCLAQLFLKSPSKYSLEYVFRGDNLIFLFSKFNLLVPQFKNRRFRYIELIN